MRVRGLRVLLVAVVGAVLVSGCTAETPANDTLPTASEGAESSAELEPLGPADLPMPVEARERTPAGAEAFIRYYMDIYNDAQMALNADYMEQFSQSCATCDELISNIREDASAALSYEGGQVTTDFVSTTVEGDVAEGAFSIQQAELHVRDSSGTERADLSAPASELSCGAILTWSNSTHSWVFAQWDVN